MKKITIANAITVLTVSAFLIACNADDQDLLPGGNTIIEAVCPAPRLRSRRHVRLSTPQSTHPERLASTGCRPTESACTVPPLPMPASPTRVSRRPTRPPSQAPSRTVRLPCMPTIPIRRRQAPFPRLSMAHCR